MRIGKKQVKELTEAVGDEGNPRIFFAPIPALPAGVTLPRAWQQLLMHDNAHNQVVNLLWTRGAQILPRFVAAIQERLRALGVLITDAKPPSLIYVFTEEGEILANRGYPPKANLPPVSKQLSVDLSAVCGIHDGWVDLYGTAGLLPSDQWEILGKAKTEGFLRVFNMAGNAIGFDLSQHPAGSYMIKSEGGVKPIVNFWVELDSWMSSQLEDMDPGTP